MIFEPPPGWEIFTLPGEYFPDVEDEDVRVRPIGSDDEVGVRIDKAWRIYEREKGRVKTANGRRTR